MFVDEIKLEVQAGRGGNGAVSFRREKFVPRGGPDGGDGGDGGSIYLKADPAYHSFADLRGKRLIRAPGGTPGRGRNQHGRQGTDVLVTVPVGTIVKDLEGEIWCDLARPGQRFRVAAGGRGGRGNSRFAGSRRRAPRIAEKGLPGEQRTILLELKLMAQVGLVGLPNAGKSTLLARVSSARPKIASYPFTTLAPVLGVVDAGEQGSFVMADLPGLIAGAHQGAGLGHRFLRHVERNLLLLLVIDLSPEAVPTAVEAYRQLQQELSLYESDLYRNALSDYPQIVVGNKLDLPGAGSNLQQLQEYVNRLGGRTVWGISAATGSGVDELVRFLAGQVLQLQASVEEAELFSETEIVVEPEGGDRFIIEKEGPVFVVRGRGIEKLAAQTDFDFEEAVYRFQLICRKRGLEEELIKHGIQDGDTVRIGKEEFYYFSDQA